jgi:hypothetical protein
LAVALATKADATLAELTEAQQKIARRIFLRLVQFGEGRADTRRQQPLAELRSAAEDPAEFDRTLEHLTAHRLLTRGSEEDAADPVVDVAHEMLIIGWPRSQEWVQSRRQAELVRRRLEGKAREWRERVSQGLGGGLLDEAELPEAERWLRGPDAVDLGYDPVLPALVGASRSALDEAERQREAARRRELDQAQSLALAERRRVRNLRSSLVVVGLLLVTAIVAAAFAWGQSVKLGEAESNLLIQYGNLKEARENERQQYARASASLAGEAVRRGDWKVAIDASAEALKTAPEAVDEVGLRLGRLRAFAALSDVEKLNEELKGLEGRTDLGAHEGSVRLWQADLLLEEGMDNRDRALALIRTALAKGLPGAEKEYAEALAAPDLPAVFRHLDAALDSDLMYHRASIALAQTLFFTGRYQKCRDLLVFGGKAFEDPMFKVLHALLVARQGDRADAQARLVRMKTRLSQARMDTLGEMVDAMSQFHQLDLDQARLAARDPSWSDLLGVASTRVSVVGKLAALDRRLRDKKGLPEVVFLGVTPPVVNEGLGRCQRLLPRATLPTLLRPDPDRLLGEIADALRMYPDGVLYFLRGVLLDEKKRLPEAEAAFRRATTAPSLFGPYVRIQSLCFLAFSEVESAVKEPTRKGQALQTVHQLVGELMKGGKLHPEQAVTVSVIALRLGEHDLARWLIREGQRQDPRHLDLLRKRLLTEASGGNWWEVIDVARRVLAREPGNHLAVGWHDRALDELRKKLEDTRPLKPPTP